MIVVPIWVALCLAAWFVGAFPLGVLVGCRLRDLSALYTRPRPGTPEPDRMTTREPPWTSPT